MNTLLLTDEIFVHKINENLEEWKKEGQEFSDIRVAWDWMKYNVHMFSIKYLKERAKTKKEREEKLYRKMQIAQTQFEQNPCDGVKNIFEECKAELENFYKEKANGLIVRARARWHEYGEKSAKYLLNLQKRNYSRKHIHVRKLCLSGVITKDCQKILDSSLEYYKELYSSELNASQPDVLDPFLGNRNIQRFQKKKG